MKGTKESSMYSVKGIKCLRDNYTETGSAIVSEYTANSLNQYTSRTVPGVAAVRGFADANATVTVNENPAYRLGEYFFGSDEFDNSQSSVDAALVTTAALASPTNGPDEVASVTSRVHVAKTPQLFEYDLDGNLLSDGCYSFAYDAANRLEKVSTNGVLVLANFYDAKSRRVKKVTPEAATTFFYDDWNLVEERVAYTNGTVSTIRYFWGKDLSGTLQDAGGVGGLLYLTVDGAVYVPCCDSNGNITHYLDSNGSTVAQYIYDTFGNLILQSGSLADFFRHRFSTKYFDVETGLYYYGCRFYHSGLVRWITRDSIEEIGGNNLYVFCNNDPAQEFDPNGCIPLDIIWDIANIIYDICVGDDVALAADTAALLIPYVPAGSTKLVKAARLSKVEKICPGVKNLEVTYKYIHVDYHFPKGPKAAKEWVSMTKDKRKSYWKPQTTDADVKGYIDAALRKAKSEGKIKPSQLKGYEYNVGSTIGATGGKTTPKIKIQIDSNGYIHAHPWP